MSGWLTRKGFDLLRLRFGFHTALTCCLALLLAWLMGLEHPQWAGMTVWAASQPIRGQLLEKSFFRLAGTVSGTAMGIVLVLGTQIHPALLVAGLALWVATCTWIGNLQRGFVAYGTVLAGYSASMVALLDTAHPDRVLHLGADRMATVLTGVLVATMAGYFFTRNSDAANLRAEIRAMLSDLLRHLADPAATRDSEHALLSRLAAIEDRLDPHAAGSLRSRREIRATRAVLLAAVPLLLWRQGAGVMITTQQAAQLSQAAQALDDDDTSAAQQALPGPSQDPNRLEQLLGGLSLALAGWNDGRPPASVTLPRSAPTVILYRDWIAARQAGLRAGGAMILFGAIWLITGWSAGAYMLLGLSVMISLFSTFDNPAHTMRFIFAGQFFGVIAAITCRWLLWPMAENELQQIMLLFPFVLLGPLLLAHRITGSAAADYNLVFLLLSQPDFPLAGSFAASVATGLAVLAAPVAAWLGYRLVYPISLPRRQKHLMAMMRSDLEDMARSPDALQHHYIWQARFYHRALRLVRISDRLAHAADRAQRANLAFLYLSLAVMRCHELRGAAALSGSTRRAIDLTLQRLGRIQADPVGAGRMLERLARRLSAQDAQLMQGAAKELADITRPPASHTLGSAAPRP